MMHHACVLLLLLTGATAAAPPPSRGAVFFSWDSTQYDTPTSRASLAALRATGAEWIEIGVTWYVTNTTNDAHPVPTSNTPTDASLLAAIADARALGFRVALKPHIDSLDGVWRAHIGTAFDAALWAAWWPAYTAFLLHYTALCVSAPGSIDFINVGTELDGTAAQDSEWRAAILHVRTAAPGVPLAYGVNWSPWATASSVITWWDAVDVIGIDAYFRLSDESSPDPPLEKLQASWAPIIANLSALSSKWGRPIMFTEIGYASYDGAAYNAPGCCEGAPALALQARLYEAFFTTVWGEPWFSGVYWWTWTPTDINGTQCNTEFSVYQKPAAAVLQRYYGGGGDAGVAVAGGTTGAVTPPPPGSLIILADGVTTWDDYSYSANVTFADPVDAYPGHAFSTRVQALAWGALALHPHAAPIATHGYTALAFDLMLVSNATWGGSLRIQLCECVSCDACASITPSIPIVDLLPTTDLCVMPSSWGSRSASFTIPLTRLLTPVNAGGDPVTSIARLQMEDASGEDLVGWRLDNVMLMP